MSDLMPKVPAHLLPLLQGVYADAVYYTKLEAKSDLDRAVLQYMKSQVKRKDDAPRT